MKKSAVFGVFFLVFFFIIGLVAAAENESLTGVDKAYSCLKSEIGNKTALTLQEGLFSALAIGWEDKVKNAIENEKGNNCWPKSGCKVKETAQAALAYDRAGKDNKAITDWIASQNISSTDLTWYIEIDASNHIAADCTVKYGSESGTIRIGDDMKLSGGAGSCLSVSSSGYWLRLSGTASCLDKEYQISCNQDFITTKLYQKGSSGTVYVSSETNSATAGGTTTEKVVAKCLKFGTSCDYEGTLWGTLALQKKGYDVSSYTPYLLAAAEDNKRFFPSGILYLITARDDQYGEIISSQKQKKFWEITASLYNKYYDSATALVALAGTSAAEKESSKDYFLTIQTPQGCWNSNNIRDTAYLLAAGWPRDVKRATGGSGNGSSGGGDVLCENAGNYCESSFSCTNGGGSILYNYQCSNVGETCCSTKVSQQVCSEKNGRICAYNERCSSEEVPAADGSCCLESCTPIETQVGDDQCTPIGGSCRSSCLSDESQSSESCSASSEVCCMTQGKTTTSSGISWLWIILLILLIGIIVAAIIYRKELQLWWAKRKGQNEKEPQGRPGPGGPGPVGGPSFARPGAPGMRPGGPVYVARPFTRPGTAPPQRPPVKPVPTQKPVNPKDKELDETMRKLREMSK